MESLYLLIPISLVFIAIAVGIFFWAVNSGQYEDVDREGERILFDDELDMKVPETKKSVEESEKNDS